MNYEKFREKIESKLRQYEFGLTWTELRMKARLPQTVPYNGWTRRLEADIGLRRARDARGIVWMLIEQ